MAEDIEQMAIDAEESARIEDMVEDGLTDEPAGQRKIYKRKIYRQKQQEDLIRKMDSAYRNYRSL